MLKEDVCEAFQVEPITEAQWANNPELRDYVYRADRKWLGFECEHIEN